MELQPRYGENWEEQLKELFRLFLEIDITMYASVDVWKWFEVRDLEHFLSGFKPIFFCLREAGTKAKEGKAFEIFWDDCIKYLEKIGYNNILLLMADDGMFRKSAHTHWTKMFQRQDEGLLCMYKAFKACFGIIGNEDRCQIKYGDGLNYSWKSMVDCIQTEEDETEEFVIEKRNPEDYEWKEETRKRLEMLRARLSRPAGDVE